MCSIGVTLRTGFCGLFGFDSEDFRRFDGLPVKLPADSGRLFKPEVEGTVSSPVLFTVGMVTGDVVTGSTISTFSLATGLTAGGGVTVGVCPAIESSAVW